MDLFEHAERYPNAPGYRQTDTSKAAADSMKPTSNLLQRKVLSLLTPALCLTADEAADLMGEDKLSIRPRFTELKALGKIEDTGLRRRNESGRSAIVWRLARSN
jgi:predicted ArsR family transcriptional regulator